MNDISVRTIDAPVRTKFLIIAAISLLAAGCGAVPAGPATGAGQSLGVTSYQSGYGVRPNGPQSAADEHLDWGW